LNIPEPVPAGRAAIRTWVGFAMMCIGMFMAILDVQVVATSLPAMQHALAIAPDKMSWVQTAYLIAEVIAISLTGFLTRLLGMRRLFVIATSVFTLASLGCAASNSFEALVSWRVLQGFAGGTLIPAVFSAVFLLFPLKRQGVATMLAGVLAVLAPTVGPVVGGWITETYSWHWLFLINIVPGIISATVAGMVLPGRALQLQEARTLDVPSLTLIALALAALEIALKEAPQRGWTSGLVAGLLILSAASMSGFVRRTLRASHPVVDLSAFADRNFTIGCTLSFVLGIGLFGSVYLMPVFLAFVRDHNALQIGMIMLVTGVAQLSIAPVAVGLEQRLDPRLLSAAGFALFAVGLGLSAFQTPDVLAAGHTRHCHHVLPVAAHPIGAGRPGPDTGARRQRHVQPHAKSGRRDRPGPHRYGHLRPHVTACHRNCQQAGGRGRGHGPVCWRPDGDVRLPPGGAA
jgi:DHA2 family multidrug resistance protein